MDDLYNNAVLAALPSGLCLVNADGGIVAHNPALEQLFGWQLSEHPGSSLPQWLEGAITDPAHLLSWLVALDDTLAHQTTMYLNLPCEFRTQRDDQDIVSIVGVVAPWEDPDADEPGAVVTFHDSSFHTDLEGARSRFLSVVSHELGGPAANIAAAADQLARRLEGDDSDAWRLIEIIQAEGARLERLLKQFLSTPPSRAEPRQSARDIVALRPLLHRVGRTFEVRDTGHRIQVQVPEVLPFVWGIDDIIEEALGSLLDNAIQYSPEGTQITLLAQAREEDVLIQVVDEGEGLQEEVGMFRPCVSTGEVEDDIERRGLGLPIARALIRSHGGDLWYEGSSEGGSCFCVRLPRVKELADE